jgi:hypothetical protein
MVEQYETRARLQDAGIEECTENLAVTEEGIRAMEERGKFVPVVQAIEYRLREGNVKRAAGIEAELLHLNELITRTHVKCFGPAQNFTSLKMLERIEIALEELHMKIPEVSPAYFHMRQKKHDEMRLEQHRLDAQLRKELDQKQKYDQAVERAQMPIKRRTGRPKMKRMLPVKLHRIDPDQALAERREQERTDNLLYGAFE